MQQNEDFRQDDARLREVLNEWTAPVAPRALEPRVLQSRVPWWRFLVTGYIRVPVPVACCLAALVLFAAWRTVKQTAPGAPCSIAAQPSSCTSAVPGTC